MKCSIRSNSSAPSSRDIFFFQAEGGIRDLTVTGVQTCALPISSFTAAQVRARLTSTAVHLGAPGPNDVYGFGLVNAYNAVNNVSGPARSTYVRIMNADRKSVV